MNADKTSVFIGVYRRSSAAIHVLAFFSNLALWRAILLRRLAGAALLRAATREGSGSGAFGLLSRQNRNVLFGQSRNVLPHPREGCHSPHQHRLASRPAVKAPLRRKSRRP